MPEIEIRQVVENDIPSLVKIEHFFTSEYVWQVATQDLEKNEFGVLFREIRYPRPVQVDYQHSTLNMESDWESRNGFLVATMDETPIGYTCISLSISPIIARITDLVVERRLRRKGIGTALLLAAMEWSQIQERHVISLEMQTRNHPAIRLAGKMGFNFAGYLDNYFRNDDIGLFFNKFISAA